MFWKGAEVGLPWRVLSHSDFRLHPGKAGFQVGVGVTEAACSVSNHMISLSVVLNRSMLVSPNCKHGHAVSATARQGEGRTLRLSSSLSSCTTSFGGA